MTVNEIFAKISEHQQAGIEFHFEMADYFDFLSLQGFKRLHEYQFLSESAERRGLHRYYSNHFQKVLKTILPTFEEVIPTNWYNYTRQDVDIETKRKAVKTSFEMWISWEKETLGLYEKCFKELIALDKIVASNKINSLICDVDMELKKAEKLKLELQAVNYDLIYIVELQDKLHKEYDSKIKE